MARKKKTESKRPIESYKRIDPRSIIETARKCNGGGHKQMTQFDIPVENLPLREAIEFYRIPTAGSTAWVTDF